MKSRFFLLLPALIVLLPEPVLAEGAVRVLECAIARQCDAAGNCTSAAGEVIFSMEPEQLDDEGAGSYQISYAELRDETIVSSMEASSFAGPFLWNHDEERHSLLANSETRFLWHRLSLSPSPNSNIQFLNCKFTQ